MRYFEVLPECPAHKTFVSLFTYQRQWYRADVTQAMEQLLGVETNNNLGLSEKRLYLAKVPDHLKEQFCKYPLENGLYEAKKSSAINKAYVNLAKSFGLRQYHSFELQDALELPFDWGKGGYHYILNRCILSMARDSWEFKVPGIVEMSAAQYFQLRADYENQKS